MEREREYTHPPGACILCHINYNSKLFKYVVTSHEKIVRENETEKEKDKGGEYLAWMHTGISDLNPERIDPPSLLSYRKTLAQHAQQQHVYT